MLSIISPSKTLDFDGRSYPVQTSPFFFTQTRELAARLKEMSAKDLENLMKISPKLATLNHERYQEFSENPARGSACQALLAFKGDVYQGMDTDLYGDEEFYFAQNHLRILSGLYGLLRPLDLIQAYRLEMGTRLSGPWGKNLYEFWEGRITDRISHELEKSEGDSILVNLASNEYFKAVRPKDLQADLLNIHFKEKKGDVFKVIGIHAKRARGLMADFIIQNKINRAGPLKDFTGNGYGFNPDLSEQNDWVFSR
ncbi:peroxide stress protein YaaA [Desulfospira joergensenii]|uniref:peroxide stress protein YaaA n=1 Tax=Desulfospira joergensenii TaxID=53329 RepID=UPI0003B5BC42|nr:peroxide stress protein YaaA [Desulfospira joergensenii]